MREAYWWKMGFMNNVGNEGEFYFTISDDLVPYRRPTTRSFRMILHMDEVKNYRYILLTEWFAVIILES